jgi:PHD/YefM family antitoxin component YafN of YafNO toxin-antitoxin module
MYNLSVRIKGYFVMSTKTIDTTELRNNLSTTIKSLGKDDILFIKSRGKLTGKVIIDDDILEDLLMLKDSDYIKAIAAAREEVKRGEVYTFDEVFGDIR